MDDYQNVLIASTIRQNVYSHRWRRKEIRRKGDNLPPPCRRYTDMNYSAKYIEGLENRLGRMESLLKMSGLLSDEDAGKTDLGTLEKRLAEKASSSNESMRRDSTRPPISSPAHGHVDSPHGSSQRDSQTSPKDLVATPASDAEKERNEEVENLSDMMCSLVTNNCGETRYIGTRIS